MAQPGSQKPGCGFPLISIVGIFCLGSGALLRAAHGKWKTSEARLFALLRRILRRGDIVVADRGFWSFANLAFLPCAEPTWSCVAAMRIGLTGAKANASAKTTGSSS